MSVLQKIISRKTAAAPAASRSETPAELPATLADRPKISNSEFSPAEKKSWRPAATLGRLGPCPACGLPAFWISVYEISGVRKLEQAEFSAGERSDGPSGDPTTLDDQPRPTCLRCPECDPWPSASLVGARLVLVEPRPGVRRLVRCDANWRPLETPGETPEQAEPGGRGQAADRPDLDDSGAASLVELPAGVSGPPVRIWTRQLTGILRRVAWTLASFPE